MSVRQAKAQPILRPARIAGKAAGTRMREDEAHAAQAEGAPGHAQGLRHREKARMHVERHRPQHRMHDHEDERGAPEAEPEERERQERDRGQRVEHGGEGGKEVGADPRRDRGRGESAAAARPMA